MNTFMSRISAEEAWGPDATGSNAVQHRLLERRVIEVGAEFSARSAQIPDCHLGRVGSAACTIDARIEYLREQIRTLQALNRK